MKRITSILLFLLLFALNSNAQETIDSYVEQGIALHDKGEFEEAIKRYEQALKLDPKSSLVNYELSLSYMSLKDYKKAIKYADKVLESNTGHLLPAYITKGSALDNLGNTKKSIKVFEEAIEKTEGHYLLYYNLALNYFKMDKLTKAEEHIHSGLIMNVNHASSHLMLAQIHQKLDNKVQTLLACHYFLFLEPNSQRSLPIYTFLREGLNDNVQKDKDNPKNTNITLNISGEDDPFAPITLMMSMLEASKSLEDNEGKTEDELFLENTQMIFSLLKTDKEENKKGIWWEFYAPFFSDLSESDFMETYINYISQSGNEAAVDWLKENSTKLDGFDAWLRK